MGTPMVMSFDIRDDTKLLPLWDILTNEEVLAVNQVWAHSTCVLPLACCHSPPRVYSDLLTFATKDEAAAVGTLISKFSAHPTDQPEYLWAEPCNSSEPLQSGWAYDPSSKLITWQEQPAGSTAVGTGNEGGDAGTTTGAASLCLDGRLGKSMELLDCSTPSTKGSQSWLMNGQRLWQAGDGGVHGQNDAAERARIGGLNLAKCAPPADRPGQHWDYTLGDSVTTNVQVGSVWFCLVDVVELLIAD
jgi:hypothetical protein